MTEERAKSLRDEDGFTLIELLVAIGIALALVGVAVGVFTSLLASEPRVSNRSVQIESGRAMLERVTRELRQGREVTVSNFGQTLTLETAACEAEPPEGEETCQVVYACVDGACERTEEEGVPLLVVSGLDSTVEVFREDPISPDFVEVWLSFPRPEGGESVTLGDGVSVRNFIEPEEGEE